MLRAYLISVVPIDQYIVPDDERVAAAVLYEVRFKRHVCFLVKFRQQALEFLVDDNRLHLDNIHPFSSINSEVTYNIHIIIHNITRKINNYFLDLADFFRGLFEAWRRNQLQSAILVQYCVDTVVW